MSVFLVTGVSGAGKTSLAAELRARGVAAIDTDSEPGLARFVDLAGVEVERPAEPDTAWLDGHRWEWHPARLAELIERHRGEPLFLCGHGDNEIGFFPLFTRVFLLRVGEETMLRRLEDPARDNDYGTAGETRELVIRWRPRFERTLLDQGATAVDAELPLSRVADILLAYLPAGNGARAEIHGRGEGGGE